MKRSLARSSFLVQALLVFSLLPSALSESLNILSPDQKLSAEILFSPEGINYHVSKNQKAVLEKAPLHWELDGVALTENVEVTKTDKYTVNESYPWRGIHSRATNRCNGLTISLKHPSGTASTLEFRAYNDGVAFRYQIPGKGGVPNETTSFKIPKESTLWYHDLGGHYEDVYTRTNIDNLPPGQWLAPPVTFKLPHNSGYASITEAALVNYSGMALQAEGTNSLKLTLGHQHPISYPFRLRYSNDVDRVSVPARIQGPIISPWRVIIIADDLNTLVNSDLVHNLCPSPDPKLFPDGLQTSWIKPGRAVWKYLDGGANSFEHMKDFSRWAGELGFEYHVIEGFWSRWSNEQLKELVDYSRERGVGLWLWRHSRELRTPEAQEAFFQRLSHVGAVGAKIDFFDHEHADVVNLYSTFLTAAARHKIMVNFHGSNKPTGESRTWPNELIREGVRGMESSRLKERAIHNTTLPFTRYLAGPGDYTPVHFGARRGDTTWAHQVGTAAVFNQPLLTYGAHPTNLLQNPALPMIKSIPPVWDETRVLSPSEIGKLALFARRSDSTWFLVALNGPKENTIEVPLQFLPPGHFNTEIVKDAESDPAALVIERKEFSSRDKIHLNLPPGGGFIARFSIN